MFFAFLLAASVNAAIMAAPSNVSPQARAIIAPVHDAIERVRADQARAPAAASDAQKLLRMAALDQAPREALATIDFSKVPPAERQNATNAVWQQIVPLDEANEQALLAMLPPEGWFAISRYGREPAKAAFLIVQHGPIELQTRFLPVLERFAARGEVDRGDYALLYDRVATRQGRPQRYGSQYRCEAGKWVLYPLEDPGKVEERRRSVGLESFAANNARFASMPPC